MTSSAESLEIVTRRASSVSATRRSSCDMPACLRTLTLSRMPTYTICQDLFRFAHTRSPVAPAAARQVTVRAGDATTRSEASAGRRPRPAICSLRARHTSAAFALAELLQ